MVLVELPSPEFEAQLRALGKVVHVCDHHLYATPNGALLDRRHPFSAIEQVARLIALDLSDEQKTKLRLIGANDRGFIPALARTLRASGQCDGKALAKLWTIRTEDRDCILGRHGSDSTVTDIDKAVECVRTLKQRNRLIELTTGRNKDGDPALLLVQAPIELQYTLLDAIYRDRVSAITTADEQLKALETPLNILALLHDAQEEIVQVEFSGAAEWTEAISQLMGQLSARFADTARLTLWCGGGDSVFFGAKGDAPGDAALLETVADRLLDNLLIGNRPVSKWRTHFFQALEIRSLDRSKLQWPRADAVLLPMEEQERNYFMPYLWECVLPKPGDGAQAQIEQVRCNDRLVSIDVTGAPPLHVTVAFDDGSTGFHLPVVSVRLHLFFARVVIVEWVVEQEWTYAAIDHPKDVWRTWRGLLANPNLTPPVTLARVLDFNATARMTFATFATTNDGDRYRIALHAASPHCADAGDPALGVLHQGAGASPERITGWFLALLRHVLPRLGVVSADALSDMSANDTVKLIWDDRARVVSSVVAVGNQPSVPAAAAMMEVMVARLQTVERYGRTHYCDPTFSQAELQRGLYKRFLDVGSFYAASSHSFVFLGFGYYAGAHIHGHMAGMYRRMFLLVLFYAAILSNFASRLTVLKFDKERPKFARLRREYLDFTNRLWFRQVSSQVQGIELFDLVWQEAWIDREYAQIKAEIDQSDDFHRLETGDRSGQFTRIVAVIGLPALVAAVMEQLGTIGGWTPWGGWRWVITLVLMVASGFAASWCADYFHAERPHGEAPSLRGFCCFVWNDKIRRLTWRQCRDWCASRGRRDRSG